MNNTTIIKYGLFISKKSTAFLEDIANGKQITNLSGYFAQFDQYIVELKKLVGQTTTTDTNTSGSDNNVSTTPSTNDSQSVTPDSGTTPPPQNT